MKKNVSRHFYLPKLLGLCENHIQRRESHIASLTNADIMKTVVNRNEWTASNSFQNVFPRETQVMLLCDFLFPLTE